MNYVRLDFPILTWLQLRAQPGEPGNPWYSANDIANAPAIIAAYDGLPKTRLRRVQEALARLAAGGFITTRKRGRGASYRVDY